MFALRTLVLVSMLFVITGFKVATGAGDEADQIVGVWVTGKAEAHIEISRDGNGYNGTIIWLAEPFYPPGDAGGMAGQPKIDRENPDAAQRSRRIDGLRIMEGFHYSGNKLWSGGSLYDPRTGKTYECRIRLTDEGTLEVRGYVGIPLLGRTTEWTPVIGFSSGAD